MSLRSKCEECLLRCGFTKSYETSQVFGSTVWHYAHPRVGEIPDTLRAITTHIATLSSRVYVAKGQVFNPAQMGRAIPFDEFRRLVEEQQRAMQTALLTLPPPSHEPTAWSTTPPVIWGATNPIQEPLTMWRMFRRLSPTVM